MGEDTIFSPKRITFYRGIRTGRMQQQWAYEQSNGIYRLTGIKHRAEFEKFLDGILAPSRQEAPDHNGCQERD